MSCQTLGGVVFLDGQCARFGRGLASVFGFVSFLAFGLAQCLLDFCVWDRRRVCV